MFYIYDLKAIIPYNRIGFGQTNVLIYAKIYHENKQTIWYKLSNNTAANPASITTILGNNTYPYNGLVDLIGIGENPENIPVTLNGKTILEWSLGQEIIYSYCHLFKNIRSTSDPIDFYFIIGIKNNVDKYLTNIEFLDINI